MKPNRRARLQLTTLLLTSAVALSACSSTVPAPGKTTTHTGPARPFNGTRPADTVLNDFAKIMDDTIKHSGTTFPTWKGKDTDGILLDSCQVGPNEGNKFAININGGSIKEPETAVNTMKEHWKTLGYTIDGEAPWPGPNHRIDLTAIAPTGARIIYSPSKGQSTIDIQSECTLDPSLNQ